MARTYVNVGSGAHPLPGFVNIDVVPEADVRHDVSKGLPFDDGSVDGVYSEHFIEHLSQAQGLAFLRECRRVLRPGGKVRLATPDLDVLVQRYGSADWRGDGDMFKMGWHWVDNRCEMMNIIMREWGHQWVYNAQELELAGHRAGFRPLGRVPWGESDEPMFRGLEYRPGSKLVMEFEKPSHEPSPEPLVSLLIPAYNARFFAEALESALAQSYRKMEILVFDDHDGSEIRAATERLARGDSRVRYEKNSERAGGLENYLKCFEHASGEFVKFLNDDDILEPRCVERMVACFAKEPAATLATSHRRCIDERGGPMADLPQTRRISDVDCVFHGVDLAVNALKYGNCVGEPTTMMFRRKDVAWVRPHIMCFGGEAMRGCGDSAMWMNLLGRGDAVYLAETLSRFRLHPEQRQNDPEIKAAASKSWAQMREHARRLGFDEHSKCPTVRVRSIGTAGWSRRRFRLAPAVEFPGRAIALGKRVKRLVKARLLRS